MEALHVSRSWYYEIEAAGFKYNLTDLAAAIGLAQLGRAAELRASRATIAQRYLDGLADLSDEGRLVLPGGADNPAHAWHLFVIRLGPEARAREIADPALPGVDALPSSLHVLASRRARAIRALTGAGIGASVHFIPLHLHPLYREAGYRAGQFPNAEAAYAGAISLPIWPGLSNSQIDRVIEGVRAAVL